jgi:hypothetical protein
LPVVVVVVVVVVASLGVSSELITLSSKQEGVSVVDGKVCDLATELG